MMKEYTDSIAFAMVSARSRQLSDDLFKIAHGTTLACETRRHFHFGFLELIGKTTCDIVNRLNGTIVRPSSFFQCRASHPHVEYLAIAAYFQTPGFAIGIVEM
jgi:hypothetical protein